MVSEQTMDEKELTMKAVEYLYDYMINDWKQNQDALVNEFFETLLSTDLRRNDVYLTWDFKSGKFKIKCGIGLRTEGTTLYSGCWDTVANIMENGVIPEFFENTGNFNEALEKVIKNKKNEMKEQVGKALEQPSLIYTLVNEIQHGYVPTVEK